MDIQIIQNKIYEIRGQRVMLDRDLAELYGVSAGNLNKAVKRNCLKTRSRTAFQIFTLCVYRAGSVDAIGSTS